MGPVRSTRSRRKIPDSKSVDANKENSSKENVATGRVLRSGKHCIVDALVLKKDCINGKNQTNNAETIRTTESEVCGSDTTQRPVSRRSRFAMTSTPITANIKPPDITLSTPQLKDFQLPRETTRANVVVFPRQYVARRPKDRGPMLVDKKKRKVRVNKRSMTVVKEESNEFKYLPKVKRAVRETADFFGLEEVSSNSPSPPPLAQVPYFKSPISKKGTGIATKDRKNKIKNDENCEEFDRWINEFNNELDEAENFELRVVQPARLNS